MRFWDASALVPLLVDEATTTGLQRLLTTDPTMTVWWGTEVECTSALARLERDKSVGPDVIAAAFDRLKHVVDSWSQVDATDTVRATAVRFLRVHALRAADALQLAAAFEVSGHQPSSLEIVTLDDRLASAARREGFVIVVP